MNFTSLIDEIREEKIGCPKDMLKTVGSPNRDRFSNPLLVERRDREAIPKRDKELVIFNTHTMFDFEKLDIYQVVRELNHKVYIFLSEHLDQVEAGKPGRCNKPGRGNWQDLKWR